MKLKNLLLLITLLGIVQTGKAKDGQRVYCDPLTVNGHFIDMSTFSLYTRGVLALVDGDPQSPTHKSRQFRVTLRRGQSTVRQWPANDNEAVYSFQLDDIEPVARLGDELVIEPVTSSPGQRLTYNRGKIVVKLKPVNWLALLKPKSPF